MKIMEWWNSADIVSFMGTIAQILTAIMGLVVLTLGIRSSQLQNRQQQINKLNIAQANTAAAEANEGLSKANERALELENKTAQAQLELQKIKDKQAPWVLTSDQETMFEQLIDKAEKGKIEIAYYLPDGERAGAFAKRLETIFKDAGYDMAPEISMVTNTSNPTGIHVFYRKDEDRNRAIEYMNIFKKMGLLCKYGKFDQNHVDLWPGMDNAVTITVYTKP